MVVLAYNFILALGLVYLLITWALGSSIKDLCAAASKNDARKCSIHSGKSSLFLCSLGTASTYHITTAKKDCVAFILVSSTTAH